MSCNNSSGPGPDLGQPSPETSEQLLLKLGNDVRDALGASRGLGSRESEIVDLLELFVEHEDNVRYQNDNDLVFINNIKLDKVIADILRTPSRSTPSPGDFRDVKEMAAYVERKWHVRFRAAYFELDFNRLFSLTRTGLLRNVVFDRSEQNPSQLWKAIFPGNTPSGPTGNLDFQPGQWWLNLACAHRDGIVDSGYEKPTRGPYGVTALPLMTGREKTTKEGMLQYIREGNLGDMHLTLLSEVGKQVRILRGYRLHSALAPLIGVRYDGVYTIKKYGQKFQFDNGLYRLELTLERLPEQPSMKELQRVPRPSQVDDWLLYHQLEGEKIRQSRGDAGYHDWRMQRSRERAERELWRRSRIFAESLIKEKDVVRA